ncbi:MAG: hypothetical protein U0075_08515 [Thermomicrobiales bacterium]
MRTRQRVLHILALLPIMNKLNALVALDDAVLAHRHTRANVQQQVMDAGAHNKRKKNARQPSNLLTSYVVARSRIHDIMRDAPPGRAPVTRP